MSSNVAPSKEMKVLYLFDIDGTLTKPRDIITKETGTFIQKIKNKGIDIGVIGGSDLPKQQEQLAGFWKSFDYQFAENGLVYYRNGEHVVSRSFSEHLGNEDMNRFIDIILKILSNTVCPFKTGLFIEHRIGMLNISPIGRQCTREQRNEFHKYNQTHGILESVKKQLEDKFCVENNIRVSIGGQISMDVFPEGWDKTYCLQYVESEYDEIHFFGDKTHKGGNDHEIYNDNRVIGHSVTNPDDTIEIITNLLKLR